MDGGGPGTRDCSTQSLACLAYTPARAACCVDATGFRQTFLFCNFRSADMVRFLLLQMFLDDQPTVHDEDTGYAAWVRSSPGPTGLWQASASANPAARSKSV